VLASARSGKQVLADNVNDNENVNENKNIIIDNSKELQQS
jgi:hypothetical protein